MRRRNPGNRIGRGQRSSRRRASSSRPRATSGRRCATSPRKAAIDPALVIRYFGSKEALFVRAADIELRMPDLAAATGSRGEAIVRHFLSIWEGEGGNPGMTILLRSAASNPVAAEKLRDVFARQVLPALGRAGGGDPGRAGLVSSQLLGLALCRYVLRAAAGRGDAGRADRARGRRDGAAVSGRVALARPSEGARRLSRRARAPSLGSGRRPPGRPLTRPPAGVPLPSSRADAGFGTGAQALPACWGRLSCRRAARRRGRRRGRPGSAPWPC